MVRKEGRTRKPRSTSRYILLVWKQIYSEAALAPFLGNNFLFGDPNGMKTSRRAAAIQHVVLAHPLSTHLPQRARCRQYSSDSQSSGRPIKRSHHVSWLVSDCCTPKPCYEHFVVPAQSLLVLMDVTTRHLIGGCWLLHWDKCRLLWGQVKFTFHST